MFETDALFEAGVFGKMVENFLGTEIGDYLLGRAKAEEAQAVHELSRVASFRRHRIQELQNRIWRAQQFQIWLAEAIADGQQATHLLESEQ